jgi:hypothetical protein
VPSDLRHPDFFSKRKERFESQAAVLRESEAFAYIAQLYEQKQGIFNPFIYWHEDLLQGIALYLNYLKPAQLEKVLLEMARNVQDNLAGLPDLFVFKEGEYAFVEVKSPNDVLSAQQLYWLEFFAEQGIKSYALRVKWRKS